MEQSEPTQNPFEPAFTGELVAGNRQPPSRIDDGFLRTG